MGGNVVLLIAAIAASLMAICLSNRSEYYYLSTRKTSRSTWRCLASFFFAILMSFGCILMAVPFGGEIKNGYIWPLGVAIFGASFVLRKIINDPAGQ